MNLLIYKCFTDRGKTYVNSTSEYQEALRWLSLDPTNTIEKHFVEYKETTKEEDEYNRNRVKKIMNKINQKKNNK